METKRCDENNGKCQECGGELEIQFLNWKCAVNFPMCVCKNCGLVHYEGGKFVAISHGYRFYYKNGKWEHK